MRRRISPRQAGSRRSIVVLVRERTGLFLPVGRSVADLDHMIGSDFLDALADLKQGRVSLTAEQQTAFLDAVEGLVRVLIDAPRGGDRTEVALWYIHSRTPALARLADAARSEGPSLADEVETVRAEDLRLLRELQANLGGC